MDIIIPFAFRHYESSSTYSIQKRLYKDLTQEQVDCINQIEAVFGTNKLMWAAPQLMFLYEYEVISTKHHSYDDNLVEEQDNSDQYDAWEEQHQNYGDILPF